MLWGVRFALQKWICVEGWRGGHRSAATKQSRSSWRLHTVTSWDGLQDKPCLDDTQQLGIR